MKTPAKKRTAAELAAAVLWCALTLGTDRLFFRYDWRTPAFFVYKALFLVLAFGLVHGAVTLVQKLRAGDKFARRWVDLDAAVSGGESGHPAHRLARHLGQ